MKELVPIVVVSGAVAAVLWVYLPPLLRFLFPRLVRHSGIAELPEERRAVGAALARNGFRYLGGRVERLGPWSYRARVYVKGAVCVDVPRLETLEACYAVSFWADGRAALTKARSSRPVDTPRYRSVGVGAARIEELLAEHARTVAAVGRGDPPLEVRSLDERLEWAGRWWREHGRRELVSGAAAAGAVCIAALVVWIETLYFIFWR